MFPGICTVAHTRKRLSLFEANACYANICYLLFIMALFVLKIS